MAEELARQQPCQGLLLSSIGVEKQTDITTNVLTALRLDNARKLELIDALIPRVFHWPFRVFAGIAGTRNYTGLESGNLRYLSARLAKSRPAQA